MYIKIKNGSNVKQYTLTDAYQKPYIKVNNNILPLTTRTTNGLHLKVKDNGQTYRPLEYKQSSSSSSVSGSRSWYSSNANGAGLYDLTALTRKSTSDSIVNVEYYNPVTTSWVTNYITHWQDSSWAVKYGNTSSYTWSNISKSKSGLDSDYDRYTVFYGEPVSRWYSNTKGSYSLYTNRQMGPYYTKGIEVYQSYWVEQRIQPLVSTPPPRSWTDYYTRSSTYGYTGKSSSSSSSSKQDNFMTWD